METANYPTLRVFARFRRRTVWMQTKAEQSIRSQLRSMVGWWPGIARAEGEPLKRCADACWKALRKRKRTAPPADAPKAIRKLWPLLEEMTKPWRAYGALCKTAEKILVAEAKRVPIWSWTERQKGFGTVALGMLIGETGPLDRFASPEKLRRYLRLCPENGTGKAFKRGRAANVVWLALDPLIKANHPVYKKRYDDAKAASTASPSHADWTKAHHHYHAHRVMEQAVLEDIWAAWGKHERARAG